MASKEKEALLDALVELSRLMVGVAYRSLEGLHAELDLPAFRALAFVGQHPGCTMGALASGVSIPASSATRLIDRLVDQNWVDRQNNPANRRQIELELSVSGRSLVDAALAVRRTELAEIALRLSREHYSALSALAPELVSAAALSEPEGSTGWAV